MGVLAAQRLNEVLPARVIISVTEHQGPASSNRSSRSISQVRFEQLERFELVELF